MSIIGHRKTGENKTYVVTLIVYALILAGVIYAYKDFMITVTAFVILGVLLFQYLVPQIREKRMKAADEEEKS